MMKDLACVTQGNKCRECVVYRFGTLCTEDVKRILHDQGDPAEMGKAVRTIMERKRDVRDRT
jgi:hypothetical protein